MLYEIIWRGLSYSTFSFSFSFKYFYIGVIFYLIISDYKLYGRACCRTWIIWSCLPGNNSQYVSRQLDDLRYFILFNIVAYNDLSSDIIYDCRLSAWKPVKPWLSKRFFKTRGIRTGNCKQCDCLITQMSSL